MMRNDRIKSLPVWAGSAARLLPPQLHGLVLSHLADRVQKTYPELTDRMGDYAGATFLIDPVDLPIVFRIRQRADRPVVCLSRGAAGAFDARISAPLAALLAMVQGTRDGDALFFSRTVKVEGDTEAILALRNAIDATEIDFAAEFAAQFGPLRFLAENFVRGVLRVLELHSGVSLQRQAGALR